MSDTAFLKLSGGSRLTNYLGLKMDEGLLPKFGVGYLYLQIPVRGIVRDQDDAKDNSPLLVKRNQHVFIEPACSVNVRGRNIVGIEPSSQLAEWGQVQSTYMVHPGTGILTPGFWFTARKDTDLSRIDFAIRIYMYA